MCSVPPLSSRARPSVHVCVLISSYKDISDMESGPTLVISFQSPLERPDCLQTQPQSKVRTGVGVGDGVVHQHMNLEGK